MITLYYIWHALGDTFRFICWMFKWLVIIMFKATVYLTLFVITALALIIGWVVKTVGKWGLGKAGVDTSNWKSPINWDRIEAGLDKWNKKLDKIARKNKRPPRRPSTDITVDEMILYDIIDGD